MIKLADPLSRAHLGYLTYDSLGYATLGFLFRTSTESSLLIKFCLYLIERQKENSIQVFTQKKVSINVQTSRLLETEITTKIQTSLNITSRLGQLVSIANTKQNKPIIMVYIEDCDN
jgi:hypothetical protein